MEDRDLLERITVEPAILAGKPVIKGTRLAVEYILKRLAHGSAVEDILAEYEGLRSDDVMACLLFASRALEDYDLHAAHDGGGVGAFHGR